jgi:hypothetical protein
MIASRGDPFPLSIFTARRIDYVLFFAANKPHDPVEITSIAS